MTHIAGCTGKRSFERFHQAAVAAKRRRRMDGGAHVEAYHCRHCNQFHVGEAMSHGQRDRRKDQAMKNQPFPVEAVQQALDRERKAARRGERDAQKHIEQMQRKRAARVASPAGLVGIFPGLKKGGAA